MEITKKNILSFMSLKKYVINVTIYQSDKELTLRKEKHLKLKDNIYKKKHKKQVSGQFSKWETCNSLNIPENCSHG